MLAPARTVDAQETCAARCLQAYTACYVRTKNRNQCEQVRGILHQAVPAPVAVPALHYFLAKVFR